MQAEAGEVMGHLGLLVGRWGERGGRLVAVGGGWGGSVVPLRGTGPLLTAFQQIGPLWEGGTPLLVRPTTKGAAKGGDEVVKLVQQAMRLVTPYCYSFRRHEANLPLGEDFCKYAVRASQLIGFQREENSQQNQLRTS